jgi:hemerythrin superfamily protein
MSNSPLLIELLLHDHQRLTSLLWRVDAVPVAERRQALRDVAHTLIAHEVAEQRVLYPAVRKYAEGGVEAAHLAMTQEATCERLLAVLQRADPVSKDFLVTFGRMREAVLHHLEEEERSIFPALAASVGASELEVLGRRYIAAKRSAPKRPHPALPVAVRTLFGPLLALSDRMRDG